MINEGGPFSIAATGSSFSYRRQSELKAWFLFAIACSVQRAACSVQRAACSVQRAAEPPHDFTAHVRTQFLFAVARGVQRNGSRFADRHNFMFLFADARGAQRNCRVCCEPSETLRFLFAVARGVQRNADDLRRGQEGPDPRFYSVTREACSGTTPHRDDRIRSTRFYSLTREACSGTRRCTRRHRHRGLVSIR